MAKVTLDELHAAVDDASNMCDGNTATVQIVDESNMAIHGITDIRLRVEGNKATFSVVINTSKEK